MKYIKKGASPRQLTDWYHGQPVENGQKINCRYDNLEPAVKDVIELQLLDEQGWLCCYTGMSISKDTLHIEHLIPQSTSRKQGTHEDVDYQNMLAAYPKGACPFGARVRGDKDLPVTPLQTSCESAFRFTLDGRIQALHDDAKTTIECLKLDHEWLDEMRNAAIEEALFPKNHRLSESQIHKVVSDYCRRDTSRKYARFCFVVAQAAQHLLDKIERERKRREAIKSQAKK